MAFQRVPDTTKLTFQASRGVPYPGDYAVLSSVYVRNTVSVRNTAYFLALCASLGTWWDVNIQPRLSDGITLSNMVYQDLNSEFGETGALLSGVQGSNVSPTSAGIAAVLCKLVCTSGQAPRSGRLYMGPVTEAGMGDSGDALTTPELDAWQAAMDLLEAAATPTAFDAWVVPSRFNNNVKRAEAVTNTVTSVVVNQLVASQTRRRRLR